MGESRPTEVLHGPPYSIVSLLVTKGSKTQALHFKFAVPFLLLIADQYHRLFSVDIKDPPKPRLLSSQQFFNIVGARNRK